MTLLQWQPTQWLWVAEDTCSLGKFWKTSCSEKMLPINWLYSLNIDAGFPPSDCVNYIHENTFIALLFHLLLLLEHHLIHLSFPQDIMFCRSCEVWEVLNSVPNVKIKNNIKLLAVIACQTGTLAKCATSAMKWANSHSPNKLKIQTWFSQLMCNLFI